MVTETAMTCGAEMAHGGSSYSSFSASPVGAVAGEGNGNNGATATYIPMYQGSTTREELNYGFDMSDLKSGINGISSTLCNGFAGVNETVNANARNLQSDICSMGLTNLQNTNAIESAITSAHYQTNNQLAAMQAQ